MDIMRLNMSHAEPADVVAAIRNVRRCVAEHNARAAHDAFKRVVGIALDTQGPEIRTGLNAGDAVLDIPRGAELTLTTDPAKRSSGTATEVFVDYEPLATVVSRGRTIYIDDGALLLEVVATDLAAGCVRTIARHGGRLGSRKGVGIPGVRLGLPALSEKDRRDIQFAAEERLDFLFASFIRRPEHVTEIQRVAAEAGHPELQVIAKIECQEALDNFDAILRVSDGVMVARGDLGVDIPPEKVFLAQKEIISKCNVVGKPVICATQMLDSMVSRPTPTRAECTDVANAVIDGSDCVMLSAETAKGQFHVAAVQMMDRITRQAEAALPYRDFSEQVRGAALANVQDLRTADRVRVAWAASAVDASFQHEAPLIVGLARTGEVGRLISQFRPAAHILLAVPTEALGRRLLMHHGILPIHVPELEARSKARELAALSHLMEVGKLRGLCRPGDLVVGFHKEYLTEERWISLLKFLYVE
eukprot:EG_transcript_6124